MKRETEVRKKAKTVRRMRWESEEDRNNGRWEASEAKGRRRREHRTKIAEMQGKEKLR